MINRFRLMACLLSLSAMAGCSAHTVKSSGYPGNSFYQLSLQATDQEARPTGLDTFAGHPVILSLFYTSCSYACPILLGRLKSFEAQLSAKSREQSRFLLVSLDPEHDNTAKLQEIVKRYQLNDKRWRLIRTSNDELRSLAALLGVAYRPMSNGEISHNSTIVLLDRQGVLLQQIDGTQEISKDFIETLHSIVGD